jgi:hypothetical protein
MQAVTYKSQQWVAATATAAGTLNRLKLKNKKLTRLKFVIKQTPGYNFKNNVRFFCS